MVENFRVHWAVPPRVLLVLSKKMKRVPVVVVVEEGRRTNRKLTALLRSLLDVRNDPKDSNLCYVLALIFVQLIDPSVTA